jgi:hypothetical protein
MIKKYHANIAPIAQGTLVSRTLHDSIVIFFVVPGGSYFKSGH